MYSTGFAFLLAISNGITLYIAIILIKKYYKKAFQSYTDEIHNQYTKALKIEKEKYKILESNYNELTNNKTINDIGGI